MTAACNFEPQVEIKKERKKKNYYSHDWTKKGAKCSRCVRNGAR